MKALFSYVLIFLAYCTYAQNISGVINTYTPVTAISTIGCGVQLTVGSTNGFAPGDKVLLIQMKGAVIDTSNTSAFGDVTNYNDAGSYEFSRVQSINGADISLTTSLVNSYNVTGKVQLIRVPEYTNANVSGTLTAQAWNGTTGGVLVMDVSNTLTMNADIDVSGLGFRGGDVSNNPDGGCGSGSPDYFYPLAQPGLFQWASGGAMKGEGISELGTDKLAGKGKLANGGGGGNKHNCGGGGGGGFTAGGHGGEALAGCSLSGNYGVGGAGQGAIIAQNRLIPGGGGGCGDYNNGVGSNGTNGGGIIIIRANTIVGGNDSMLANGLDETIIGTSIADGVGGGGAGGLIFLDVSNYNGNLVLQANGGKGGDQNPTYGCVGTGGGGGTGTVLTSQALIPPNVSIITMPGAAGVFLTNSFSGCPMGSTYYATGGTSNSAPPLFNLPFIEGPPLSGTLPVKLGNDTTICAGDNLLLKPNVAGTAYLWNDGSTSSSLAVSSAGVYWVQVTSGGCVGADTIVITTVNKPAVDLGNDTTLCVGALLNLTTDGLAAAYVWQDGTTASFYNVSSAGQYSVTASNGGCAVADTINVVYTNLNFTLGNDTVLCRGQTLMFNSPFPNDINLWQNGSTATTLTATVSGSYTLTVSRGNCSFTATVNATFNAAPYVELGNDTVFCSGNSVSVDVTNTGATYAWSDGSLVPLRILNATGIYAVTVSLNGCSISDSLKVDVIDTPSVNLGSDTSLCEGRALLLNAGCAYCTYVWQDNSVAATYIVKEEGDYSVAVSNSCGTATDAVRIEVEECRCRAYVPTAFSANGDGVNDNFKPIFKCNNLVRYDFRVYNRWGELVFSSSNPKEGWDGTYKGVRQAVGVFIYVLRYAGDEGDAVRSYEMQGNVTLIR
ncbi:MAG: gliding motility-associated C-terminal domain-containing protein [Chitinophagales bacterium]